MRHLGEWMHSGHTGMSKWIWGAAVASLLLAVQAWATPPFGFVVNQILVSGVAEDGQPAHADLYISYLVKHGQPRRREEAAPPCAFTTPIP